MKNPDDSCVGTVTIAFLAGMIVAAGLIAAATLELV